MADTSLIIGNGNWAVKETSLLGYNIIQSKYVPIEMTVSRNTTATRVNSAGLIESVAINVPRLDYTGGGCPKILVEPLRTNLVLYSEQFNDASWDKSVVGINTSIGTSGIESNVANAPSGTLTADRVNFNLQADLDVGMKQVYAAAVATQSFVSSIYVKGEGSNIGKQIKLRIKRSIGGSYVAVDTTITLTSDWVRITSSALTLLASNTGVQYIISSNDATNALIWGAQLEQGSNATSYIPTVAATATRNADVISKTGISSLIGQTEGTLYAEINITTFDTGMFFTISDGTSTNRIQMYKFTDNKIYCDRISATQSASTSLGGTGSALSVGTYKVAFAYQSGNSYLYINGAQVGPTSAATFTFGSMGKVNIGSRFDDASTFNDRIKSAILFPTRLTPGQCIALTT